MRTILSLIFTNSEVRKLLTDFSVIGRDLLAKGASMAAERLRPGEEELARVNEAAPQDEFVTKGGRKIGPGETPILEAKVPGTDTTVEQHPRADDAKVRTGNGEEKSGKQVVGEGRSAVEEAQDRARGAKDDLQEKAYQAKGATQEQADQARRQGCVVLSNPSRSEYSSHCLRNLEGVGPSSVEAEEKKQGLKDRVRGYAVCSSHFFKLLFLIYCTGRSHRSHPPTTPRTSP